MLAFLDHCFQYAEIYSVILAVIVIPLGYYAVYLFMKNHYGLFAEAQKSKGNQRKGH